MEFMQMPRIEENYPLRQRHSFATEASARFVTTLFKAEDLQALREATPWQNRPHLILGAGSNTLFQKDFPGLIIFNHIRGIDIVNESSEHVWLKVGAGENWHELVQFCISHNYAGIENLSLIPGTVGAAPIQNIGAYGVELESVFHELSAVELASGKQQKFSHTDCDFGYRYSVFKHQLAQQYCITDVTLRLNKNLTYHLDYGQIRETLKEMGVESPSIKSISEAIMTIRRRKLPDPTQLPNAGSFFKNPVIDNEHFAVLLKSYPNIPHYAQENNMSKIPAAWLIEQCGWRGKRCGPVGVHEHQALVIINYDHGTGEEICKLAETIQADVRKKFLIELTPEVSII
jgi:UDP-N-acetylmuramate dehydrogenase